ncbi:hypothetical protein GSI_06887 [Ganoderma sinense ZZ0214-1]|uniref:Uncharacterized protein n=1 Tax=Ganoderma sinense ZZ0214-1 TaxID=1077348 RepID=A0A2G8SAD5_9APHY|nr:hypothetical protein GSI_06887 [Ganoderma sinense ZZ0214-1]
MSHLSSPDLLQPMPRLSRPGDVCLCPLYTPVFDSVNIGWLVHTIETDVPTRRIVCARHPSAVGGTPQTPQPFIFELIGEISEHDCHLTVDGYGDRTEGPIASCWIKPSPGSTSRIEWAQGARTIRQISDTVPAPFTLDVLAGEGNPLSIQLFFEPPEGENLQDTLPVFNRNGARRPPMSLSEVPFQRTMRFLFTINYSQSLTADDGPHVDPFKNKWNGAVKKRVSGWKVARKTQSTFEPQLKFNAECMAYTDATWDRIKPTKAGGEFFALPLDWPFAGPEFHPPGFLQYQRRHVASDCNPEWVYIKVCRILHPLFFPWIARCPNCHSRDVDMTGWTGTGHREVHGLASEECVIGVQFRCEGCAKARGTGTSGGSDEKYCFSTTNPEFWAKVALSDIPRGVPHFFRRSAVSPELFDFIVESRLSENAAAIAEHVKQLHLLEYHRCRLEYLQYFEARSKQTAITRRPELRNFSAPQRAGKNLNGYDGTSITDDMVADVYARFCEHRQKESDEHLRTLTATTLSLDATFRAASKASIVNEDHSRSSIFNGGLHTAVNQKSLIVTYRWCLTLLHSEIGDMLLGLKQRFALLNVDDPWAVVVDNCCHFRNIILKVFSETVVVQDVWHVIMRYMICVLRGTKNPHRREVAEDISSALIKTKAHDGIPARYWSKEEQEDRLVKAYEKWIAVEGVWSAAAEKTHHDQLEHVRKGCLSRPREDVATDGSRVEGTHKGWNSLQRTHPSGVEVLTLLAADHVLRHNIRVDYADPNPYAFTSSTFGSHHVHLVNACAQLWNSLLNPANRNQRRPPADLLPAPVLQPAASQETFGLVKANKDVAMYHSFVTVKEEPEDSLINLSAEDPEEAERIVRSLGLDPSLLSKPLEQDRRVFTSTYESKQTQSQMPSEGRSAITFVSARDAQEAVDVDAMSSPPPPSQPLLPSSVPPTSKKRQASRTLSRACEDHDTSTGTNDKRTRTIQSDAPSSSAPLSSTMATSPSSSLCGPERAAASAPSTSAGFSLPTTSSLAAGPSSTLTPTLIQRLPSYFSQCRLTTPLTTPLNPAAAPLCLPIPIVSGTTRSQIIVSVITGLDPRSLKFPENDSEEFYLFMELREHYKWVTYNMSALGWVEAASVYNTALEKKKHGAIRKTPRALMEKLEEHNDFKSQSGSTTFWKRHCEAVDLSVPGKHKGKQVAPAKPITRKPNTCHRCLSIMWARGEGDSENHKKGYCSDGVKQKPASVDGIVEELPPWPQPNQIFTKGTHFWPQRFTRTVRELYDTITDGDRLGGPRAMEFAAFADMLRTRLIVIPATDTQPSCVRFKLYRGLKLGEQPGNPSDIVVVDGVQYLHVTYLSETGFEEVAALA